MKKVKKPLFPFIITVICSFLVISSLSLFINNKSKVNNEISQNKMFSSVKRISNGVNDDGYPYQTYSFEVKPDDSTYKNIKVKSIEYISAPSKDDPLIDDVLEVEIDNTNKTFTVIQINDFKIQILLTFCSVVDESVEASIKIDCVQKWLGFKEPNTYNLLRVLDGVIYEKLTVYDLIRSQFYMVEENYTSLYTIECKQYSFSDASVSYYFNSVYEVYGIVHVDENTYIPSNEYHKVRRMNVFETSTEIDKSASKFINSDEGLKAEELREAFKKDYLTWNETTKNTALNADYYGFVVEFEVTYSIGEISRKFPLNAYIVLEVEDLIINPQELILSINSIKF